MTVLIYSEPDAGPPLRIAQLRRTAVRLLALCGEEEAEWSIAFVSDARIAELNARYRGKPKPTNVLSFPMDDGEETAGVPRLLGDVVISAETAAREAEEFGVSLHQRVTFLLVHGLLHLLGFDHERSEEEAAAMEEKEQALLARLKMD